MGGTKATEEKQGAQGASVSSEDTPKWVQLVLDSAQLVIESNKLVIDAAKSLGDSFKALSELLDEVLTSNKGAVDGNQALAESNERVVFAVEAFREKGGELVDRIIEASKPKSDDDAGQVNDAIVIDTKAKYRVVEGRKIVDKNNPEKEYLAGENVTHLGEERLKNLLAQGLIEEA
ncbi:hypothetical protein [Desertivirga xinjiangensis]|uniref:hypothetical protein n=1 Tax=Desertivirga xinjiangensis TaxID=539206 RepID=UPI00210A3935|nr:hypothetical protein [Pedobacter xinjiangensis]